jgi:hypothetical protein
VRESARFSRNRFLWRLLALLLWRLVSMSSHRNLLMTRTGNKGRALRGRAVKSESVAVVVVPIGLAHSCPPSLLMEASSLLAIVPLLHLEPRECAPGRVG